MTRLACPVIGCDGTRNPQHLTCYSCWTTVPRDLQRAVYRTWQDGAGLGTSSYRAARQAALQAAAQNRGHAQAAAHARHGHQRRNP